MLASFFLFLHCNTAGHNFMTLSKCFSHPFKYTKKTTASKAVATAYYLQNEMGSEEGCPYEWSPQTLLYPLWLLRCLFGYLVFLLHSMYLKSQKNHLHKVESSFIGLIFTYCFLLSYTLPFIKPGKAFIQWCLEQNLKWQE